MSQVKSAVRVPLSNKAFTSLFLSFFRENGLSFACFSAADSPPGLRKQTILIYIEAGPTLDPLKTSSFLSDNLFVIMFIYHEKSSLIYVEQNK